MPCSVTLLPVPKTSMFVGWVPPSVCCLAAASSVARTARVRDSQPTAQRPIVPTSERACAPESPASRHVRPPGCRPPSRLRYGPIVTLIVTRVTFRKCVSFESGSGIAIASALSAGVGLRGAGISESRSQGRSISWCSSMSPGRSAACVIPERPAQDERRLL
jgi:hypothetical protein